MADGSDDPRAAFDAGLAIAREGGWKEAVVTFGRAAALAEAAGSVWLARATSNLGVAYATAGDLDSAERCWARAAGLALPEATACLGALYLVRGARAEALHCLERASSRLRDRPEPPTGLAVAYAVVGAHAEALACVGRAIAVDEAFGPAYRVQAALFARQGLDDEAARCRAQAAQCEVAPVLACGLFEVPLSVVG